MSLFLPKPNGPTICPVAPARIPTHTQHAGTAPLRPSDPPQTREPAPNSIGKRGAKSPRDAPCNGASKHWSTHPSFSCQGGCQAGSFTNLSRSLLRVGISMQVRFRGSFGSGRESLLPNSRPGRRAGNVSITMTPAESKGTATKHQHRAAASNPRRTSVKSLAYGLDRFWE